MINQRNVFRLFAKSVFTTARTLRQGLLASGLLVAALAAHGEEILVGASLPLSGALAGFGNYQKWGYEAAIADRNRAGGINVGGTNYTVKLVVRDDKTDPNVVASNTETMISRDKVLAMLGSSTPSLVTAGALVAERRKVPFVTAACPLGPFRVVRKWTHAWDIFFDESELAKSPFRFIRDESIPSNKRAFILHDNGPDGQIVGGLAWPKMLKETGFELVQNESFPIDATQFTAIINDIKSKAPDLVMVMTGTPQAIAIRKQLAAAGVSPAVLVMEKGAEPEQFAQALGELADGVFVGAYWDPSFPYPGAAELAKRFEQETHQSASQHIADSYVAAQVLLDAIASAGSMDREQINAAIGRTNKMYLAGPIHFDATNTATLPATLAQWQGGKTVIVWPKDRATGKRIKAKQ